MSRNSIVPGILILLVASLAAPAQDKKTDKTMERAKAQASDIAPPFAVSRPVDLMLENFGRLITTFNAAAGQGPICIEIDFMRNEGGDQFPSDISDVVRNLIEKMHTDQICTFKTLPSASASSKNAVIAMSGTIATRAKPPAPTFRLEGWLEGASQIVVKSNNGRVDGTGGGGNTATDGSATKDRGDTITALTVGLTLERPDSVAIQGASAEYRVNLVQNEKKHSFSLYVGGNGFGFGAGLKVTNNNVDGLADVVAVDLVKILGNGLGIPYVLSNSDFAPDPALAERVRNGFQRTTQSELERLTKRYMIVAGYPMQREQGADLTPVDRATVGLEMRRRNLAVNAAFADQKHAATVEFLMQLWRSGLDFQNGPRRVSAILAQAEWMQREQQERQALELAGLTVTPNDFGWTARDSIVVVNLTRVPEVLRSRILLALQACTGCGEMRRHPQKPYLAFATSSKRTIQYALRSSTLPLDFVWPDTAVPQLILLPLAAN